MHPDVKSLSFNPYMPTTTMQFNPRPIQDLANPCLCSAPSVALSPAQPVKYNERIVTTVGTSNAQKRRKEKTFPAPCILRCASRIVMFNVVRENGDRYCHGFRNTLQEWEKKISDPRRVSPRLAFAHQWRRPEVVISRCPAQLSRSRISRRAS